MFEHDAKSKPIVSIDTNLDVKKPVYDMLIQHGGSHLVTHSMQIIVKCFRMLHLRSHIAENVISIMLYMNTKTEVSNPNWYYV